jgi:hypothetical protein
VAINDSGYDLIVGPDKDGKFIHVEAGGDYDTPAPFGSVEDETPVDVEPEPAPVPDPVPPPAPTKATKPQPAPESEQDATQKDETA